MCDSADHYIDSSQSTQKAEFCKWQTQQGQKFNHCVCVCGGGGHREWIVH